MKTVIKFVFLMMIFIAQIYARTSEISTVWQFKEIDALIDKLYLDGEKDVWIVFDLDETLVVSYDACLNVYHEKAFDRRIEHFKRFFNKGRSFWEVKLDIISQMREFLADSLIPLIIEKIKTYGFKSIILTSGGHGASMPGCKNIEEMRWWHLYTALNSADSSELVEYGPFFMDCDLGHLFNGEADRPLFYRDMIFCGPDIKKDWTFAKLLQHMNETGRPVPKYVLFVDNVRDNVEALDNVVGVVSDNIKVEINYYGFEYVYWNRAPELSQEEMDCQIIQYFTKKTWFCCNDPLIPLLKKECPEILRKQKHKNKQPCCCPVM